jgi:lipoate-protein ligase A
MWRGEKMDMEIKEYILDDDLISHTLSDRCPRMRIYVPDGISIVIGYGGNPEIELNITEIERDKIPVFRRRGGGCAVLLDPGNVIVSVVLPSTRFGKINEYFEMITNWLMDGLGKSGIEGVYREGISDLAVGNRKIGGACMQRKRDYVYYSASLLVNPDIGLIERFLKHPPREPEYRKKRQHREFLGAIKEIEGIKNASELMRKLEANLDVELLFGYSKNI